MGDVTIEDLIDILEEITDLSGIRISEDLILGEDIPVDSRDMLRILSRIESRYSFRFMPKELLALRTLGDMLKTIRLHTQTKP